MEQPSILPSLYALPYRDRVQEVLARGRRARTDPAEAAALDQLAQGDASARRLALFGALGARDGARVMGALSDSSRLARGLAYRAVPSTCDDAQTLEALHLAYQRRRHTILLRRLQKKKRQAPIDAFIEQLAARNDPRFQEILPYGSPSCLARHLARAVAYPSQLFWERLRRRQPDALIALLQEKMAGAELDPRTRALVNQSLGELVQRRPVASLVLVERLHALGLPDGKNFLAPLLLAAPRETFAALQRMQQNLGGFSFGPVATRLDEPQLLLLLRLHPSALGDPRAWLAKELRELPGRAHEEYLQRWFQARPQLIEAWLAGHRSTPTWGLWLLQFVPSTRQAERQEVYERWSRASRNTDGIISTGSLRALPWEFREREARRHLTEVKKLDTQPLLRLPYCAYLPWEEAKAHLAPFIGHPEPEVRALAIGNFFTVYGERSAAGRSAPSELEDALSMIIARRFEQDPIRQIMLKAAAGWPRAAWRAEHLPQIEQIVRAALDAADLSYATAGVLESLLRVLLPLFPDFVADRLLELLHIRGGLQATALGRDLSTEEADRAAPALLRIASRLVERAQQSNALVLLGSLGSHLARVPAALPLLLAEAERAHNVMPLNLLRAHFRGTFDAKISQLLSKWSPSQRVALLLSITIDPKEEHEPSGPLADLVATAIQKDSPPRPDKASQAAPLLVRLYRGQPDRAVSLLRGFAETLGRGTWDVLLGDVLGPLPDAIQRDDVAALAEQTLRATKANGVALFLLTRLQEQRPNDFARLVPQLLQLDRSFVVLEPVYRHLDQRRPDLLDEYLDGVLPEGRFTEGRKSTEWLFPVQHGAYRWTPPQQERFSRTLDAALADEDRNIPELRALITRRIGLPYAPLGKLPELSADKRIAVRETVIRALARLDAGQGIPALLECLGDDRARYAIYGFRKALLELPAEPAVELLRQTPLKKVTVAKELMRILGELRSESAYQFLLSLNSPTLHRDVRVAQLRALWEHLERAETWEVFARAVQDPDWILASKVAELPLDRLSAESERKMSALVAQLLARPEPEARVALLHKVTHLPLVDSERAILRGCLALWTSSYQDERRAAVQAVLYRAQARDVAEVSARLSALLPLRHGLAEMLGHLHGILGQATQVQKDIARGVLRALLADKHLAAQALQLAARVEEWPRLREILLDLAARDLLHPEAMPHALSLVQSASLPVAATEAEFLASPHAALRRLALALLVRGSVGRGWSQARKNRLETLQRDPSVWVASAAQLVFPPF